MSINSNTKTNQHLSKVKVLTATFLTLTLAAPASGHTLLRSGKLPVPDKTAPTKAEAASAFSLIGTKWQATEIEGAPPVPTDRGDITLFFDSERVSGFAGCNEFSGGWEDVLDSSPTMFTTGPLGRTRVFCGEDIMQQEDTFLGALRESTAYSVSGNGEELTLYATAVGRDDNSEAPHASLHVGRPIVRLTRIPSIDVFEEDGNGNESDDDSGEDEWDADEWNSNDGIDKSVFALEGSNWKLAEIRGFEAIGKRRPVTLSFDSDTRFSGFDGCNSYWGPMNMLSGNGVLPSFRAKSILSTRRGCRSDALRKQMNMFYDVLRSNAVTYNIVNGENVELELYAAKVDDNGRQTQGELLARFTRVETEFW